MEKLITWFDVETAIFRKMFEGLWPEGMIGVSVYPDEVQIRIKNDELKTPISDKLYDWFGARYDKEKSKIYLEFTANGKKRALDVTFEEDPEGEPFIPGNFKPNFPSFSLYPENPRLKGPDFSILAEPPSIWAFYSFKGGVGRTTHLISLVKALSEIDASKKILIVDADLEAPGLTWWSEDQFGKPDISFLDFLALAHYDQSPDYSDSLKITTENLRHQVFTFETPEKKVEHFFLPAFRESTQLMRFPVRPENVCWETGKEWLIPELLWKLGKTLGVDAIIVDLRAGLSEISSSLLFDPRVNRFIVTSPSGQSVEGTKQVLLQIKKISNTLKEKDPVYEAYLPTIILSMVQEELKDIPDFDEIREELLDCLFSENTQYEELLGKNILMDSLFDGRLLYLKNLKSTLEKLNGTDLHKMMQGVARDRFPFFGKTSGREIHPKIDRYKKDLEILKNTAEKYVYAETGKANDFLITRNLKMIARKFKNSVPVAAVMGAKGSGKTYTYLQMAHLKQWSEFTRKVLEDKEVVYDCFIWPLLASWDLEQEANTIIDRCRQFAIVKKKNVIQFNVIPRSDIEEMIGSEKEKRSTDISSWRRFWIQLMAKSLSCDCDPNPLAAMQKLLSDTDTRIIFQWDGLENYFDKIETDEVQQTAIQSLCQSVVNAVLEWPDNRIGLLIFTRKDLARSSIKQNFSQFESLYGSLEITWGKEEALRLAAWLVNEAAGLKNYVDYPHPIENVSGQAIETALEGLWGTRLGSINSREAFSANWVIAALSDFKGQLQARDLVRLIHEAAKKAMDMNPPLDRLLPASAIKKALDPCSSRKIEEIQKEISGLKGIFEKLKKVPQELKQVPFDRNEYELTETEIKIMTQTGLIKEYYGKYYFPEIIRRGLGFPLATRGRQKVLTLLKRAMNK